MSDNTVPDIDHPNVEFVQFITQSKPNPRPRDDRTPSCDDGQMHIVEIRESAIVGDDKYRVLESCDSCSTTNRSSWVAESVRSRVIIRK